MEWIQLIIGIISGGAFTQLLTIAIQRKKAVAEVTTNELGNVGSAILIWKNIAIDLEERLKMADDRITRLIERVDELEEREEVLTKELNKYRKNE